MTEGRPFRWRKTDESIVLVHCPNHEQEFLFYARTYTIGQGYRFSETNQLVLNLKMSPNAPDQRLRYKQQAIRRFASEVIDLLRNRRDPAQPLTLVPIPPSKERSHPEHDDRMEQVAEAVAAGLEQVSWLPLLSMSQSMESYHLRADGRDPEQIYALMQIETGVAEQSQAGSLIVLLDDVLTSGAHFTAARRRILEVFPDVTVLWVERE